VQIGASDAYMSDAQVRETPEVMNVPLAIAAQTINYNLPGLNTPHLKLDGPALAGIYTGCDPRVGCARDRCPQSPAWRCRTMRSIPVHRAEGSGDTFVFTQFLTFSTQSWEDDKGYGTTIGLAGGPRRRGCDRQRRQWSRPSRPPPIPSVMSA